MASSEAPPIRPPSTSGWDIRAAALSGFMLPPSLSLAARSSCFGHPGAGGSLGLADRDAGFAFAYVMNQMSLGVAQDPRAGNLLQAVYNSLG